MRTVVKCWYKWKGVLLFISGILVLKGTLSQMTVLTNSEIPFASLTTDLTSFRCVMCGKSQALETDGPG